MTRRILFLCTGNSARSIMAESYFNHVATNDWLAFSAGSMPTGEVNPFAISTLEKMGIFVGNPISKSWDEFALPRAPKIDVVVTVCDNAANETCPVWPGAPERHHWPFSDPAAVKGCDEEKRAAFIKVFAQIRESIDTFLKLERPEQRA